MLAAAELTYFDYCATSDKPSILEFRQEFIRAWSDFTRNALSHIGPAFPDAIKVELGNESPTLYVIWHFPEYPLLMHHLAKRNVIVAAAQDAEWLRPLAQVGLVANFSRMEGLIALRRACEKGQSVAMMLDFCYEGTRNRVAKFLGLPCKTPSGLIELAHRFGLGVRLISISDNLICTELVPSFVNDADDCLEWLNTKISGCIERDPTRWLLWPSLWSRVVR